MPIIPKNHDESKPVFIWELEDVDYASYESVLKYMSNAGSFTMLVNENILEEMDALSSIGSDNVLSNPINDQVIREVTPDKVPGVVLSGGSKVMYYSASHRQPASAYITKNQHKDLMKIYNNIKKKSQKASTYLRNLYAERKDAYGKHLNMRANQLANYNDLVTEISNPEAGNRLQAEGESMALAGLNMLPSGMPKFETEGLEKCIEVMEQKDVKGAKSFYDDYMTMMSSGAVETKIQYERQKAEKDGWNIEKENKYLGDLRRSHLKIIEAYDRLWEIDVKNPYAKYLNNELDHMIGKKHSNTRDINDVVGILKGEVRAIELGYDSKHLYILGQVGMMDQYIKKMEAGLLDQLNSLKDEPDKQEPVQDKIDILNEFKQKFEEFKKSVWDKPVYGKLEMEEIEKKLEDFAAANNVKENKFIWNVWENFKAGRTTCKNLAKNFELPQRPVTKSEYDAFKAIVNNDVFNFDRDFKSSYEGLSSNFTGDILDKASLDGARKGASIMSAEFGKKIDELTASISEETEYPRSAQMRIAIAGRLKLYADAFAERRPFDDTDGFFGESYELVTKNILNAFTNEKFIGENLKTTEKVIKDLDIDKFLQVSNELHEKEMRFESFKDKMTGPEREKAYQDIVASKKQVLEQTKNLYKKLSHPSKEVTAMFGGDIATIAAMSGGNGLTFIMNSYEIDVMKMDISKDEIDSFDKAFNRFNTARAGIFKSESAEHAMLREEAEAIRENIQKLVSGTMDGIATLTEAERKFLLEDTVDRVESLKEKADAYIKHAAGSGSAPSTDAGKSRLAGAKDIKRFANSLDKILGREPQAVAYKKGKKTPDKSDVQALNEAKANSVKWLDEINKVDFNMLGKGSKEFEKIVERLTALKHSNEGEFADEDGTVDVDNLADMDLLERGVLDSINNYLAHKKTQIDNDPERLNDPAKAKREQPRIKTVIDLEEKIKESRANRAYLVVEKMQKEFRAKLEQMLAEEEARRDDIHNMPSEYAKSVFKSLHMINNLDGSKWQLKENESLMQFVDRVRFYADPETYRVTTEQINAVNKNPYIETFKSFKDKIEGEVKITSAELKAKYTEDRKNISPYIDGAQPYDIKGRLNKIKEDKKKRTDNLVPKPKKPARGAQRAK